VTKCWWTAWHWLAGACLPILHRALIEAESPDNGLHRTTPRQEGDDLGDDTGGVVEAMPRRAGGGAESLAANLALKARFFAAMPDNVAFSGLSSGGTVEVRAK
jgi:hypothetical protein